MNEMLRTIISLSLSGSLLIFLLFLGRIFWKDKISKRWQYYIWLVVIARLLLPFTVGINLVGTLFWQADRAISGIGVMAEPEAGLKEDFMSPGEERALPEEGGFGQNDGAVKAYGIFGKETGTEVGQVLWFLWAGVVLVLLVRKVTVYQSFVNYMKAGRREVSDISLLELLSQAETQAGIKKPVELYTNALVSSPLLLGFFCPCIILPTADLPEEDFQYTIRHELIHYKRRDMFYKWLMQLTVCLHWFNPLVYLMRREIGRACELSCDEAVVETLDDKGRQAYGDTLLRAMGAGGSYRGSAMSVTLNESVELLKERLSAIMNFTEHSRKRKILASLFTFIFMLGALAAGAYASPDRESPFPLGAVKGEEATSFRYTQEGYYQAPYLFEIGWNVRQEAVGEYEGTEMLLSDGSTMTVLFMDTSKAILEDKDALGALGKLLARMREETAETEFPLTRPLLVSVRNIGSSSPEALAEQCYRERNIAQFLAAFRMLDEEAQGRFLEKIYNEKEIAFFAASLSTLREGSPLIGQLAEKAYEDSEISFFSVLAGHMDEKMMEEWISRAVGDKRTNFQSMLLGEMGKTQELDALEDELEAQRMEEYRKFGITKDGNVYYYQGRKVAILLDLRPNSSFVTLDMNPEGEVKIRITRDEKEKIESVGYLTKEEEAELFGEMEEPDDEREDGAYEDEESGVVRLDREQLPVKVQEAMNNCAVRTWYLIPFEGQQYLYCNGFAWECAYEPVRTREGWEIKIVRTRKKNYGYFLLSLPDDAPVVVKCDGEEVWPVVIEG